jgi:hypothetical protein
VKNGIATGLLVIPVLLIVFLCVGVSMLPAWFEGLVQERADNTAQVVTAHGRASIDYAIARQIDAATRAVENAVTAATWYPVLLCVVLVALAVALGLMVRDARRELREARILANILKIRVSEGGKPEWADGQEWKSEVE